MSTLQHNPQVEEAPLQEELMLFHPGLSQFFLLNPTMAYIWHNCPGKNLEALIAGMAENFEGLDREVAAGDVRKALDDLLSLGLVIDETSSGT